jgi:hypothetical protein
MLKSIPASASREGWALANIPLLFLIALAVIIIPIVIGALGALIGANVSRRKGKSIENGIIYGALGSVGLLTALCVILIPISGVIENHKMTEISAWLLPLESLAPTNVRPTLNKLIQTMPSYDDSESMLAMELAFKLGRIDEPLTPDDILVIEHFLNELKIKISPKEQYTLSTVNIRELQVVFIWKKHRLAIADAITDCHGDDDCLNEYGGSLIKYCGYNPDKCAQLLDITSIEQLSSSIVRNPYVFNELKVMALNMTLKQLESGNIKDKLQWFVDKPLMRADVLSLQQKFETLQPPITREDKEFMRHWISGLGDQKVVSIGTTELNNMQGAIVWAYHQFSLDSALSECGENVSCGLAYLDILQKNCEQQFHLCRQLIDSIKTDNKNYGYPNSPYQQNINKLLLLNSSNS